MGCSNSLDNIYVVKRRINLPEIRRGYCIVLHTGKIMKLRSPQSRGFSVTRPATYSRYDEMSANSPQGGVDDGIWID